MSEHAFPLDPALAQQLTALSATQLAWLSGYCWAQSQGVSPNVTALSTASAPAATRRITILAASQTGNARRVAEALRLRLESIGLESQLYSAADYKSKNLSQEDIVLLVASTQGEGEPPEEAIPLYKFLFGKKAPDLSQLSYAVLALGDSSYPDFCQAGKDFDAQLAKLGATRLGDRGDCDLDYQADADAWSDQVSTLVATLASSTAAPIDAASGSGLSSHYSKAQPYHALLSVRQKITASGANKDIQHIEIDLGEAALPTSLAMPWGYGPATNRIWSRRY